MKTKLSIAVALLATFTLSAQVRQTGALRASLNGNPYPQLFFGTSAPGSVAGNLPGDLFSDTNNNKLYQCNAASGTAAPACTAPTAGGWALLNTASSGGGATTPSFVLGSNILTVGGNLSGSVIAQYQVGATVYPFTTSQTASSPTGTGNVRFYISPDSPAGGLIAGYDSGLSSLTCSGGMTCTPSIAGFPVDSIPLATWHVTSNSFDGSAAVTVIVAGSASYKIIAGSGIGVAYSGNGVTLTATGGGTIASTTSALKGDGAGNASAVTGTSSNCVHVDGSSAGCGGGGGGTDPMDMTIFTKQFNWAETGPSGSNGPWAYTSACGTPIVTSSGVQAIGELSGLQFTGANCYSYYPGAGLFGSAWVFKDFMSGSTPKSSTLKLRFINNTLSGANTYIGWSNVISGSISNFMGIVYAGGANTYNCSIVTAGTYGATNVITGTPDTSIHTFVVTQTSANSISCSIDGGSAQVTSGTIPTSAGGLWALIGTDGASTSFSATEARLQITGLSR